MSDQLPYEPVSVRYRNGRTSILGRKWPWSKIEEVVIAHHMEWWRGAGFSGGRPKDHREASPKIIPKGRERGVDGCTNRVHKESSRRRD